MRDRAEFASGPVSVQEAGNQLIFQTATPQERLDALRRRAVHQGPQALEESEALELLLATCGVLGPNPGLLARALIRRFGSLAQVFGASSAELAALVGDPIASELKLLHDLTLRVLTSPLHRGSVLASWNAMRDYLKMSLRGRSREAFRVLYLDTANQLIADELMGDGTVDHAPVYPREIMRRALELAASACCLVHNHPAGGTLPSKADIDVTRLVVEAGRALGIAIHDHFLVAGDEVVSFKGLGLM